MNADEHFALEFRRPLAGIIELADLLLDSGLDDRQAGYARALRAAAAELMRSVEVVLAARRAAFRETERYPFNLVDALRTAVACCSAMAESKHSHIHLSWDPHLPPAVEGNGRFFVATLADLIASSPGMDEGAVAVWAEARGHDSISLRVRPCHPAAEDRFAAALSAALGTDVAVELQSDGASAFVVRLREAGDPAACRPPADCRTIHSEMARAQGTNPEACSSLLL